jgi:hypothetical protein
MDGFWKTTSTNLPGLMGPITRFRQWIVIKWIRYFTFTFNYFDKLTAIRFLIILFVLTEDANDNDGIDIEYQHRVDDETTNFIYMDDDWKKKP